MKLKFTRRLLTSYRHFALPAPSKRSVHARVAAAQPDNVHDKTPQALATMG